MELLSVLMVIQGLIYSVSAIINLSKSNLFKYGTRYYNTNLHLIGMLIGILLIISGIGIWINKRKAYYIGGLILYVSLFTYGLISTVYLGIVDGFELGMTLSSVAILAFFCFISKSIYKRIQNR